MTQTKTWDSNLSNTIRKSTKNSTKQGAGNSRYLFVGRSGTYDYDSFVRFTLDWTDVGRIVAANLVLYTSDGHATAAPFPIAPTKTPNATVKRLGDAFSEGIKPGTVFENNDYSWADPPKTESGAKSFLPAKAANEVVRVDITPIVNMWAPPGVTQSNGTSRGGGKTNYGVGLYGTTSTNENISFWSEEATDPALRPSIELEYEYGHTAPFVPDGLSPVGDVVSIGGFQGDFSDPAGERDKLQSSTVQVFEGWKDLTSDYADVDDIFHCTNHGLVKNDIIYFTALAGGAGVSTFTPYWVMATSLNKNQFKLTTKFNGASIVNVTNDYISGTWAKLVYTNTNVASSLEAVNGRSDHVPAGWAPKKNVQYQWRMRFTDSEGQASPWTELQQFSVSNYVPNAPTLQDTNVSLSTLGEGYHFRGTFSDPDVEDTLLAYQIQMAALPEADPGWDVPENLVWDTAKQYVPTGSTGFDALYGGAGAPAATYRWRARVWDNHDGTSLWSYGVITLTASFVTDPGTQATIQLRPHAPWRIVIKAMGTLRGPGATVAILENAKSIGASIMYNSPGELHFTLPVDDPQISLIEPKQTHYAVEFYSGDGWREVYAGLMWDFDATETDVVFYGIDYLSLYDYTYDEHYDPSRPELAAESGGSKYVSKGKNSIGYIIRHQLQRAKDLANSPVGFITIPQSEATLKRLYSETVTAYSTFEPTLSFCTGLLDSHKQGGGKKSRLYVRKGTGGGYEIMLAEDPGQTRDNLRLRYGELVQGYRIVAFGKDWGSRLHAVGRDRNGYKVRYTTQTGIGTEGEATWGRFPKLQFIDGISDGNDLIRRTKQLALSFSKLGRQLGIGLRTGVLQPRDGYDICDQFPVSIHHGAVNTESFGSGYWTCYGIAWEAADQGQNSVILTLLPRDDDTLPDTDLIDLDPISPQKEWQIGWTPPNPLTTESLYWLDQNTGIVYVRVNSRLVAANITGTV